MNDSIAPDTPQKQCKACQKPFLATLDNFYPSTNTKDGLESVCKTCRNERRRSVYATHKVEQDSASPLKELICSKCGKSKPFTEFRKSPTHRYGRHSQCEQCRKETRNSLRSKPEVRARERETGTAWRQAHLDKRHADWRRYAQTENGKWHCRTRVRNRRSRQCGAKGMYTSKDIQRILKAQKGKCYYCSSKLDEFHIDHIIPLSRGGSNDPSNLVLACPPCNLSKYNKLPHEWPQGNRLL